MNYNLLRKWSFACSTHSIKTTATIRLLNHYCSSAKDGFVRIGDVTFPIRKGKATHLVPVLYKTGCVPQSVTKHLRWMIQKDLLKQDMFLIGPPGPLRRNIAMMYLETTGREFEYISLSRDTTESDLKQRRELSAGTASHAEQCAVRAALQGRVLVLEGVEKAERNVLPVLNNLLENREMQLDDGRFLVSSERYDKLLETHTEAQLHEMKIVRVHPDFRVVALGLPVPHYHGNPLDPPFRSRFQGRSINHLSYKEYLENLLPKDEASRSDTLSKILSFGMVLKTEEAKGLNLPDFPLDNISLVAKILRRAPHVNRAKVIERLYPHQLFTKEVKAAVQDLLKSVGLDQDSESTASHFESIECSSTKPFLAKVKLKIGSEETSFDVPCGGLTSSSSSSSSSMSSTPLTSSFSSTPFHDGLLSDILISHSVGDFCIVGPRGCGKSTLVARFAELLGYRNESIMLYQDMTPRDLLQQRTMDSSGNTGWKHSALVEAALEGGLAVLDGIHRVHPSTLSVLHRLINDRELDLFDGTRLLRHDRYDHLKEANSWSEEDMRSRKLLRIHPSFRIVGLSEPPSFTGSSSSNWLTSELLTSFLYHPMRQMSPLEESQVLSQMVPNYSRMESVLKFAQQIRNTNNNQLKSLSLSMSTRQLVRLAKRLSSFADDDTHHLLHKACLTRFLPAMVREAFEEEVKEVILESPKEYESLEGVACEVNDGILKIGTTTAEIYNSNEGEGLAAKVPDILFYDNPQHTRVMEDMLRDFVIGEHLLLVGNQGVGKNKVTDRFLGLLRRPREYIQLHRDTTVQTLTVQPTVRGGLVEYEDSPLVRAVREGRVLVVDEADKAPTNVTCILKCLVESGFMHLPDGRKIVPASSTLNDSSAIIKTHPDFRMIVLANRPGFPFLGNDFFGAMGDLFGTHAVDNPDPTSELSMLCRYAPSVNEGVLEKIVCVFGELREMADRGEVSYPFSTREAVSIAKHLEMFPGDGLANVVENVFDFDSYDDELKKSITEVMRKHGVPVGTSVASVKLSKEFPLPAFKYQGSVRAEKICDDLISERTKIRFEDAEVFEVRKSRTDSRDSRSLAFGEEESVVKFPLVDGSFVARLAVACEGGQQAGGFKGHIVHALATDPLTLYSFDVTRKVMTFVDIESLLPWRARLKPKIFAIGRNVVVHDGKSQHFHVIATDTGLSQKVSIGRSKISGLFFKQSQKSGAGSYTMVTDGSNSDGKVVFYKGGSGEVELFDFGDGIHRSVVLPISIAEMFTASMAGDYILKESSTEKFYMMRESSGLEGRYEFLKLSNGEGDGPLSGMDFITSSSLDKDQLSASLGESTGEGSNRILSSSSSFATILAGMPESTSIDCFKSERTDFNATKLPSATEVACLPTNGVIVRVVSTNNLPLAVREEGMAQLDNSIGFLEVVDVVNKTLRYINIPGSQAGTYAERWQMENQLALNKSSRYPNPNGVMLSTLGGESLCSLDRSGHLRIWELIPTSLSDSLQRWRNLIGDGESSRPLQITHERELNKIPTEAPKHGKVDPTGAPHVGGSTFAGGSGGMGTAGLGGVGGPYRLDGGGDVYQVSDADKANVPPEILEAARQMALRAWKQRLKEIEMSEPDAIIYERFVSAVRPHIKQMRTVLDSLQAKSKERHWLRHQTHGDVDEGKLIEGVIGERGVYKRRGERDPEPGSLQEKPKHMRLVCDVSGSMYRFNGHDGRLDRQLESLLMVMEAFEGYEHKITYEVFGHSGEGPSFPFVTAAGREGGEGGASNAPRNDKQRLNLALSLVAHSQFCLSGDHTLEATRVAIDSLSRMEDVDEKFVVILSDANVERYGISPAKFGQLLKRDPDVNAYVIFIGSLGDQAQRLLSNMPAGHSFICKESKQLPGIMRQIFMSSLLS